MVDPEAVNPLLQEPAPLCIKCKTPMQVMKQEYTFVQYACFCSGVYYVNRHQGDHTRKA